MKKIILSGGWSYGNLGDEAILMASLYLLHEKFPHHTITVLVYKENETAKYLRQFEYVTIGQSLHSYMYGVREKAMNFGEGVIEEITQPIKRRLNNQWKPLKDKKELNDFLKSPSVYFSKYGDAGKYFSNLCEEADMYVMSGGGYFNNWNEMIISKYYEVILAKQHNLKTYMIGQTVGPFNKYARQIYKLVLDNIDNSFFRDIESIKDTRQLGFGCLEEVVPDLALGIETLCKKENNIVFIPFLTDLNRKMDEIVDNLKAIYLDSGCKIIITVSQQWPWCMQIATSFYLAVKAKGIDVKYVIPEDFKELETILSSAQFVFSQNLHGLIMAYRGHTPVVCLNNRRKFVSFMSTIGQEDNLITPSHITSTNLYEAYKRKDEFDFSNCIKFQKQIKMAIDKTIR